MTGESVTGESEEQQALRDVLRSFFAGGDTATWQRLMSDIGADALIFDVGQPDCTPVELAILAEEAGAALFDGPLVPSVIAGAVGDETLLAPLRDGTRTVGATVTPVTDLTVHGGTVDVVAEPVWGGAGASQVIVTGPASIAWLDAESVTSTPLSGLDLSREFTRIAAQSVRPRNLLQGKEAESASATAAQLTSLAISAELLGVAQHAFDHTVDYLRTRVQFGRTIGSFQAIKHRLADLLCAVELARSAVYGSAGNLDDLDLAVAATLTRDAALSVTRAAVQLHGGIAITWEHWAHRYLRRAHAVTALTGSAAQHRRLLADLIDRRDGINV